MLKKRPGTEAIERNWSSVEKLVYCYFKIPSTLIIPEGCVKVGGRAFWRCDRLKKVIIPEGVERIGLAAFEGCPRLEEVEIPKSVKYVEEETRS